MEMRSLSEPGTLESRPPRQLTFGGFLFSRQVKILIACTF